MYKILNENGELIAYTDNIRWIKKHSNGSFVQCDSDKAEGVAVKGKAYSLDIRYHLEDVEDVAKVRMEENSDVIYNINNLANENDSGIVDVANLASENDIAVTDLAEYVSELEARIEALESKEA